MNTLAIIDFLNEPRTHIIFEGKRLCLDTTNFVGPDTTLSLKVADYTNVLTLPISVLGLDRRTYQCLKYTSDYNGRCVQTIGELISLTEKQVLAINGIGAKSIEQIKSTLALKGLKLGE